ncbi:patatin-like phospholipase family protein [Bacillus sp. M6-12]|uniref:patatin-like phospholipase family protein n=1 Tax=Bacillus sp. M6-12 TaxID=2054166 RepID=UPI0015E1041C|nr:patatin-like phospholipase family protein [Bacillus sp. M6-12]
MKKIGLVLAGGGGKGAYQIGVWKALREFGVDQNIQAISGTSVGALNTLLFTQGDLERAKQVWLEISPEKILTVDPAKLLLYAKRRVSPRIFSILETMNTSLIGHGWFSREGLLKIIRDNINFSLVTNSNIPIYATCLHALSCRAEYFKLNGSDQKRIESILLASSAIPFIFDPVEIDGDMYWDGGISLPNADNIPVKPLYDEGCDVIIAVHLSRTGLIDHSKFPEAKIIEILPQEHQGGVFKGTLDFTRAGAQRRMDQGYHDTKRIFQPIYNMVMVQRKIGAKLNEARNDEIAFQEKRRLLKSERELIKKDIEQYIKR